MLIICDFLFIHSVSTVVLPYYGEEKWRKKYSALYPNVTDAKQLSSFLRIFSWTYCFVLNLDRGYV